MVLASFGKSIGYLGSVPSLTLDIIVSDGHPMDAAVLTARPLPLQRTPYGLWNFLLCNFAQREHRTHCPNLCAPTVVSPTCNLSAPK